MEKGFLDKVEDNATVRTWSKTMQQQKGDSLADGYVSKLWDFTCITWVAAQIKQKGDSKCIPWTSLKELILTHSDVRKRLDVFALSIYGLAIFPKALGHVDEAITDLFDRLDKKVDNVSYRVFSENYSPLKEIVATPRRDDILEEKWIVILQNLQEEDVEWRAP
ncbi:hypothetical protein Goshw_016571 [Gossypium schwendimanii]|uniref:Uncharacterized protein n=1 Tax=Gossypium schwendimanii TaxID=34291 RepID=A0A7J9KSP8_GOSSC|nr:hypothetical protein [Gossypium schwendimanii]